MTDIVERLRGGVTKWGGVDCAPDAILAAADEIERLRAEIVLLETTGAEASDEIERLRAEVHILSTSCGHCGDLERAWQETERLRAALLALTLHEEAAAKREGLEPCHEAQEARWLLNGGKYV